MACIDIREVEISSFYGTISHVEGLSVLIGTCWRPYRLSVRTQASQAWKPGSIPGRVIKSEFLTVSYTLNICRKLGYILLSCFLCNFSCFLSMPIMRKSSLMCRVFFGRALSLA